MPIYPNDLRRGVQLEVVRWPQFQEMFYESHRQGEHVAIVGPNGSGKTRLGLELCKIVGSKPATNTKSSAVTRPSRVTVLAYKPRDDSMREALPEKDWPLIKKWPPSYGQEHCIIWVRGGSPGESAKRQRNVFVPLIDMVY